MGERMYEQRSGLLGERIGRIYFCLLGSKQFSLPPRSRQFLEVVTVSWSLNEKLRLYLIRNIGLCDCSVTRFILPPQRLAADCHDVTSHHGVK